MTRKASRAPGPREQEIRMMGVLERQAAAHWTYAALGWAAQQRGDATGATKAMLAMMATAEATREYVYSGAYLKGRPLGLHTKHIDDTAAHAFMTDLARTTGERRGETLAKAALAAGLGKGKGTAAADLKRLAARWRTRAKE